MCVSFIAETKQETSLLHKLNKTKTVLRIVELTKGMGGEGGAEGFNFCNKMFFQTV